MDADALIAELGLDPHPEGGHYAERWRAEPADGSRGGGSSILFLLRSGERSHWHRVDADERWYFHAGAPLRLAMSPDDATAPTADILGLELVAGHAPDRHVPAGWWQAAETTGEWTLVSCVVVPAFRFDGFELAPPDFTPGG